MQGTANVSDRIDDEDVAARGRSTDSTEPLFVREGIGEYRQGIRPEQPFDFLD